MSDVNAKLGTMHGFEAPSSKSVARSMGSDVNITDGAFDANLYRKPDYYIYIYSVADRDFVVSQPPLFRQLIFSAKEPNQRYRQVLKIPAPFQQVDREGAVGDIIVRAHPAERVAQSLCNPNNVTLDQDAVPPETAILGLGQDLNAQGVFWSKNHPPTEEEIKAAEKRRERYYRSLIERARTLEIANPKELEGLINQDYHMAAEYFGVETSWHRKMVKAEECPNCGETIKPGIAYHKNSLGFLCIVDMERAKKAGVTADMISPAGR